MHRHKFFLNLFFLDVHASMHASLYTQHTHACKLVHTTHTCMQAWTHNTHMHASLYTQHTHACKLVHTTHTCMQACTHNTHMHASLDTQHTHACKLVHTTHTCAHTRARTHTHTHTCKRTLVSWSATSLLSVADQNKSPKCQPTAWSAAQCQGHCLCDSPKQLTSSTSACSLSACVELGSVDMTRHDMTPQNNSPPQCQPATCQPV